MTTEPAPIALYHVSEVAGIRRFDPRPTGGSSGTGVPVVWAVDSVHLCNYLLPRECPRVTFAARHDSSPDDVAQLLPRGPAIRVVAVEARWLDQIRTTHLSLYRMPVGTFRLVDECAGYHVSTVPVTPTGREAVDDLPGALRSAGAELRILPSLHALRRAVIASTLEFSIIRFRNAAPAEPDEEAQR